MMPVTLPRHPKDVELDTCVQKFKRSKARDPWKAFRTSACGRHTVELLHDAYGARCLYCDHAHGRTIDHVESKTAKPSERFSWANWRPCCGDCNNLKGTKTIVDPARTDPRRYVIFDLTTGVPIAVGPSTPRLAKATCAVIDNQTLNEARRLTRLRTVAALARLAAKEAGAWEDLQALLDRATPHRAIIRELVLESDPALNPYRATVDAALTARPELAVWAANPR